jgi:hypothetical protein
VPPIRGARWGVRQSRLGHLPPRLFRGIDLAANATWFTVSRFERRTDICLKFSTVSLTNYHDNLWQYAIPASHVPCSAIRKRGLIFVACHASIETQFEVRTRNWVNADEAPRGSAAIETPIWAAAPCKRVQADRGAHCKLTGPNAGVTAIHRRSTYGGAVAERLAGIGKPHRLTFPLLLCDSVRNFTAPIQPNLFKDGSWGVSRSCC